MRATPTPVTVLVYNERVKLAASAINLVAVGLMAVGVTAPLVSVTYGTQVLGARTLNEVAPVLIFWLACAFVTHLWAQSVLGRLVG